MTKEADRTESQRRRRNRLKHMKRKKNPDWRKKQNKKKYQSRRDDPEWRANQNQKKYQNRKDDPEWRANQNQKTNIALLGDEPLECTLNFEPSVRRHRDENCTTAKLFKESE